MPRPRVSIAALMGVVIASAIAIAALRNASENWAGAILSAVAAALGLATLGAVFRRGREQAFWLGFVLFGAGYALFIFGPWFSEEVRPHVASSSLLDALQTKIGRPQVFIVNFDSKGKKLQPFNQLVIQPQHIVNLLTKANINSPQVTLQLVAQPRQITSVNYIYTNINGVVSKPMMSKSAVLSMGALKLRHLNAFSNIGQALFALLAGLAGGLIALYFHDTRKEGSRERTSERLDLIGDSQ
jgi:hypothetical protein